MFKKLLLIFVLQLGMLFFGNTAQALSIKIGHNDTSYDGATAALFKVVFERSGYNVSEIKGDSDVLLSMLDRGEIDFYLSAWLPGRDAESFAAYQENLTLVTPLYENASSFFAVPRYIPQSIVTTIDDLSKPEVIERMNKTIVLDERDGALGKLTKHAFQTYSLTTSGYALMTMTPQDWDADLTRRLEEKIWFTVPMTKPHLLNLTKKFRFIKDPQEAFGGRDTAWLVANKKTQKKIASHIFEIISKMELSTKWVAEIDQMAYENDWPHYVAARVWMAAHPYTVEYWISSE
ncbi:MAG: hypothetical protein NWS01_07550 [Burkholderiales bacterium]|jgi:glycine betaine/proline transport system substrate-binding protein|nr:hypothetical protein [Burkholderiales bacterium]